MLKRNIADGKVRALVQGRDLHQAAPAKRNAWHTLWTSRNRSGSGTRRLLAR
jgi:hypothetical protein